MTDSAPMFSGDLSFLSNFDTTEFWYPEMGVMVRSAEHAFNAAKTLDADERIYVLAAATPGEAKRRGRRASLRPGWDQLYRVPTMRSVLAAKFTPLSLATPGSLAQRLVATKELELVETNYWHDQFWGSCLCPRHRDTAGVNTLGRLLMARRAELQR